MSRGKRVRLDQRLIEMGLARDRRQAEALVLSGRVTLGGKAVSSPAAPVRIEDPVVLEPPANQYVSRGGLKLAPILEGWSIPVKDVVCLDVGASTGGFTDCLLQHGARLVYALDVGRGQLDWSLRNDDRVLVMEGINARQLRPDQFPDPPSLVTVDVSFISVSLILTELWTFRPIELIVLVKPQFEAHRVEIPSGGVIRDRELRSRIVERVKQHALETGFTLLGEAPSPVKGQKGNREFFLHLKA